MVESTMREVASKDRQLAAAKEMLLRMNEKSNIEPPRHLHGAGVSSSTAYDSYASPLTMHRPRSHRDTVRLLQALMADSLQPSGQGNKAA